MIRSTMQDGPLTIGAIMRHGARVYGRSECVTWTGAGTRRASYATVAQNAGRLAGALARLGIGLGDPVATFCWNNQEHLEAYFGVPAMGAVLHTLNIRLPVAQVAQIVRHAGDRIIIVDDTLVPLLAAIRDQMPTVEAFIVNGPGDASALEGTVPVLRYADLLAAEDPGYDWPELDERAAALMCYTSGTTGDPKGVVLHQRHHRGPQGRGVLAPVHLPARDGGHGRAAGHQRGGPGASHRADVPRERVGSALRGVPVRGHAAHARPVPAAAAPDRLHRRRAVHGHLRGADDLERDLDWRMRSGRVIHGVEMRLVGKNGDELPWDGVSEGEIEVRGPWVTGSYHNDPAPEKFRDGWLRTGDVGTIDDRGFFTITDRIKDVIKSGGEWISSVDLENQLMAHPAVQEAAVIGMPDSRWASGRWPAWCSGPG